jgi:hypothetical protein
VDVLAKYVEKLAQKPPTSSSPALNVATLVKRGF